MPWCLHVHTVLWDQSEGTRVSSQHRFFFFLTLSVTALVFPGEIGFCKGQKPFERLTRVLWPLFHPKVPLDKGER